MILCDPGWGNCDEESSTGCEVDLRDLASGLEKFLYSGDDPAGPEQVSQWMKQIFADRLAARNALLRSTDLPVDTVPEVDLGKEDTQEVSLQSAGGIDEEKAESRFKFNVSLVAVVLVVVLALVVFTVFLGPWGGEGSDAVVSNVDSTPSDPSIPVDRASTKTSDEQRSAALDARPEQIADVAPQMDFSDPSDDGGPLEASSDVASHDSGGETSPPEKRPEKNKTMKKGGARPRGPPGKLNLLAIPPAEVRIGSRSLGRTPLFNVELPPGPLCSELVVFRRGAELVASFTDMLVY